MIRCTACKDPLPSVENVVSCAGCDGGFHFECSGLSRTTWRSKGEAKKLEWRCRYCRRASRNRGAVILGQDESVVPSVTVQDAIAGRTGSGALNYHRATQRGVPVPTEPRDDTTTFTPTPFHITLAALRRRSRILLRIPKGARIPVAEQLTATNLSTVANNDEASWQRLLCFSFAVLVRPSPEKRVSLTTKVKSNLTAFAAGTEDSAGPLPAAGSSQLDALQPQFPREHRRSLGMAT